MKRKLKLYLSLLLILIGLQSISQTYVGGGIFSDETWNLEGSPYIIDEYTKIFSGITVSIEPGVEVLFNSGVSMDIQGNFIAMGTPEDSVFISANHTNPQAGFWAGINFEYQAKFILEYVKISYSSHAIYYDYIHNSSYIHNSVFYKNIIGISSDSSPSPEIDIFNTDFRNNSRGIGYGSSMNVINCVFSYTNKGAELYNSNIQNCSFDHCFGYALIGHTSTINNCDFYYNNLALRQSFSGGGDASVMTNLDIRFNVIGLEITGNNPLAVFDNCVLCENSEFNVVNTSEYSGQDLSNNCWCTDDIDVIQESIFDAHDDLNVGLVVIEPLNSDCDIILSDEDLSSSDKNYFYPNPTDAGVYMELQATVIYDIFTLTGQLMQSGYFSKYIDLSNLNAGVYTIRITQGENYTYQKVVKR